MKQILKIAIVLGLCIISAFLIVIVSQKSNPNSMLYPVKRMSENVILTTKFTPQLKADYYIVLLPKRLDEFNYILDNKQFDSIITVSLRYSTTAGNLTNIIKENALQEQKQQALSLFQDHKAQIASLSAQYQEQDDRRKFIDDAVNYLTIYSDQLQN